MYESITIDKKNPDKGNTTGFIKNSKCELFKTNKDKYDAQNQAINYYRSILKYERNFRPKR
jgi:hypothetical protein